MAVMAAMDLKAVLAVASAEATAEAMVAVTVEDTVDMANKCVQMQNGTIFACQICDHSSFAKWTKDSHFQINSTHFPHISSFPKLMSISPFGHFHTKKNYKWPFFIHIFVCKIMKRKVKMCESFSSKWSPITKLGRRRSAKLSLFGGGN